MYDLRDAGDPIDGLPICENVAFYDKHTYLIQLNLSLNTNGTNSTNSRPNDSVHEGRNHTGDRAHTSVAIDPILWWIEIIIPIICAGGIIGNILNLLVLRRKRIFAAIGKLERSATLSLIALALSDLLVCLASLPHGFLPHQQWALAGVSQVVLFYKVYVTPGVNLFMMTSIWLTVQLSASRNIVVLTPLRARYLVTTRNTIVSIAVMFVSCLLLCLPFFVQPQGIFACSTLDGVALYEVRYVTETRLRKGLSTYIINVWPIVAIFVPLCLLLLFNTRLIVELRRAKLNQRLVRGKGSRPDNGSYLVNLTLILIVLTLLVFGSPSELLRYVNPYQSWGPAGHRVAAITNMLQVFNFSSNFLLYCAVNPAFRRATVDVLCSCLRPGGSGGGQRCRGAGSRPDGDGAEGDELRHKGHEMMTLEATTNQELINTTIDCASGVRASASMTSFL